MSAFGFLENFYHGLINKVVDESKRFDSLIINRSHRGIQN